MTFWNISPPFNTLQPTESCPNSRKKVSGSWANFSLPYLYLLLFPVHGLASLEKMQDWSFIFLLASYMLPSLPKMASPRFLPGYLLWKKCLRFQVSIISPEASPGPLSVLQWPLPPPSSSYHTRPFPHADPPSLWSLCTIHFLLTPTAVVLLLPS